MEKHYKHLNAEARGVILELLPNLWTDFRLI